MLNAALASVVSAAATLARASAAFSSWPLSW